MVNKSVEILRIDRTDDPYTQKTKKANPYICDIRARIDCEPLSEHSTRSDRVTNIGYLLSLGAVFLLEMELLFHVGVIWGIARRFWLSVENGLSVIVHR